MNQKAARALVVVTIFALLAVLSISPALAGAFGAPRPAFRPSSFRALFFDRLNYYLAWALVAPGIFWLARRAPLVSPQSGPPAGATARLQRRSTALLFHLAVPLACLVPFFFLRAALTAALGGAWPPVPAPLRLFVARQMVVVLPTYWLLISVAWAIAFSRQFAANALREARLERSLAAAELDALKMKVQPHFLFNTLNAVASLAAAGETEAVTGVVERLGTLLRLSMDTSSRQFVTLEEELALIDEYLAIEEVRFADRLHVVRRVAPEVRRALVPHLILQPIIENALVHGVARRLDSRLLELDARREGRSLRIAVRDDGPGLPAGWTLPSHAGADLRNLLERLRVIYGGKASFEMSNDGVRGALAVLRVPFAETELEIVRSPDDGDDQDDHRR